jgi:hypothetical protein
MEYPWVQTLAYSGHITFFYINASKHDAFCVFAKKTLACGGHGEYFTNIVGLQK